MNTICLSFYCLLGVGKKNENKREFILQNIGGCFTVGKIVQTFFFLTGITNLYLRGNNQKWPKKYRFNEKIKFLESHAKKKKNNNNR